MPRDDLSIDFVKRMTPGEALDPAQVLDEWINRTQNLPEEVHFMQEEIEAKDQEVDSLVREIEDRDARIQRFIKANGSHADNPKECEYRATIKKNFGLVEQLATEKIQLAAKLQRIFEKHLKRLDEEIKALYDRNEPGFTDPDELPSMLRPNAHPSPVVHPPMPPSDNAVTAALASMTNNALQAAVRSAHPQLKTLQTSLQHVSASPPTTPAAIVVQGGQQAREGSAGTIGGPKRGPRVNTGILGNASVMSSGLVRHSSLGPGTPKALGPSSQRAGSAGPRASVKTGVGKKGTPSCSTGGGRKRGTSSNAGGSGVHKSGLSRVKRAGKKNSPSSTADSELSDADSESGDESDARTGWRGSPAASVRRASSHPKESSDERESRPGVVPGVSGGGGGGGDGCGPRIQKGGSMSSPSGRHDGGGGGDGGGQEDNGDDENGMEVDDEDAGDDRKYCLCQNVSFGDMVACDNDDCPYEWFHWSCVGLKSEPTGAWFCPVCAEERKKKGLK